MTGRLGPTYHQSHQKPTGEKPLNQARVTRQKASGIKSKAKSKRSPGHWAIIQAWKQKVKRKADPAKFKKKSARSRRSSEDRKDG